MWGRRRQRRTLRVWQLILAGPVMLIIAVHEYIRFDDFEKHGGTMYVGRTTKALYELGGKNLVVALTLAFAALYVWFCVRYFRLQREAAQLDEANAAITQPPDSPRVQPPVTRRDPPPRLGDDPFREPPAPPPIVVQRPSFTATPAPAPIVPSDDPGDGPKLLR